MIATSDTNERLHAATIRDSLVSLGHGRYGCKLLDHFVVTKGTLYTNGGLSCSNSAVLSLQQLNLFVQQILRKFITAEMEMRMRGNVTN